MEAIGEFILIKVPEEASEEINQLESGVLVVGGEKSPIVELEVLSVGMDADYDEINIGDIIIANGFSILDFKNGCGAINYKAVYAVKRGSVAESG